MQEKSRTSASATAPGQNPASKSVDRSQDHDRSLAELYYRGFLEDLVESGDSLRISIFVREVFTAPARLLSDKQKLSMAWSLAEWAAGQSREVRTLVWKSFGSCDWVRPLLGVVQGLPKHIRKTLLEIDPDVHAEVIAPWLGDRPGRILPLRAGDARSTDAEAPDKEAQPEA
jgi:hypothetical protein